MSSPIPPPPAGSQPSYVPPSGDQQNPYAPDAGAPAAHAPYGQPADHGQAPAGQPPFAQPADYGQAPYGQTPYGQAPGEPYGQAYGAQHGGPAFPGGQRPSSGLAIAALVVGAISLIIAWVPVINIVSIIGGIVAVVLGVIAVRKASRGVAGGKGMAIAGAVLGGVSLVVAIIVNVVLGTAISEAVDAAESAAPAVAASPSPADAADEQTVDTAQDPAEPADAEAPAAGDLLPLGQSAEVGDYTITVTGLNLDADDAIAAADEFNPPADGQYVIADLSVVYNGAEEGNPWMDLSYIFTGSDAEEYDDGTCMAIEENSVVTVPTLAAGDAAEYEVCMDVPAEAIEGGTFSVAPFLSLDSSERATWAIN